MLNSTNFTQKNTFNSPASGIIQKSHKYSYFVSFNKDSETERCMFNPVSRYKGDIVIVLQVLLLSENGYLVEIVSEDAFNKEV